MIKVIMDREETSKILSIVKSSYPTSFKDMSKGDMVRMLSIWERKFQSVPADLVLIVVDELISVSKFPPSIAEVTEKLNDIYWKNFDEKWASDCGTYLPTPEKKKRIDYIHNSLCGLCDNGSSLMIDGNRKNENNLLG